MRKSIATSAATAALFALLAGNASALEKRTYDASAFAAAQKAGKSILVDVHAVWCHICWSQKAVLSNLESDPKFKNLVVFSVDYDGDKENLRRFNAQKQSTLIVFKGGQELGRSVGDTNPVSIKALLSKSL